MNWEDFAINIGVSALLTAIKSPAKRKTMRAVFLKVYRVIKANYGTDPDFQ